MKQDERSNKENTVSLVVGGKTLYLFNLFDPDNPIELAFQARYGNIVAYKWFGDGYILIGKWCTGYRTSFPDPQRAGTVPRCFGTVPDSRILSSASQDSKNKLIF
jgi:hypothetical protein